MSIKTGPAPKPAAPLQGAASPARHSASPVALNGFSHSGAQSLPATTKPAAKSLRRHGKHRRPDEVDPSDIWPGMLTPAPFFDFSFQDDLPHHTSSDDSDFASRIDAEPLNLMMLHGEIQEVSDAQLDHWCRQLSGPWPAGERVNIEMPLPGLGAVDVALENHAAALHVSVEAGTDAARQWFAQQRKRVESRLRQHTGKAVSLEIQSSARAFLP